MNRFSLFILFSLLTDIATIANAKEFSSYKNEFYNRGNTVSISEEAPASISATVSGSTSVCQNAASPVITFTGSGGVAPYKFTYNINGGGNLSITSAAGNDNATVHVNTSVSGNFIYTLTSVSDATASQTLNVQAIVTVNALPLADFTYTDQQCSGTGVLFTPTLTGPYTYAWNFGDGTTSIEAIPTHLFSTPVIGTLNYLVKLTITDNSTTCQNTVSKNITVSQGQDATLNGSGYGTVFNGVQGFRICSNEISTFTFSNASLTTGTNQHYTINWGDGTPDFDVTTWTSTTHTYQVGMWNLTYTVAGPSGCVNVKRYYVFVGSNPAVTLGNPGNTNICISQPLTFLITGTENNSKGTTYTVSFNDGSPDSVYQYPAPKQITHTFLKSSCGITSSDGSTIYQNSFFAKITATNPCGPSASSVMPIYVSVPPTADFTIPATSTCTNTQICLTNSSKNGNAINGGSCSTNSNLIWHITPATGYTLKSGSLGTDFGSNEPSLWSSGSNALCPVFTQPGIYTISMKIGNRCNIDSIKKTICIEGPLAPQFGLSSIRGCAPFNVAITNNTDTSKTCSPGYKWTVGYTSAYCGTTSGYTYTSGTSATSFNPSLQFTNPGIYTIQLAATNSCGTQLSVKQVVTVTIPPVVSIRSIPDSCGTASVHPVGLVATCAPAADTLFYVWSFPGGSPESSTGLDPGIITYKVTGNYTVSLSVTNKCGVPVTATQTFTVKPIPGITNTVLSQTICSGFKTDPVVLTCDSALATYSWTASATAGITGFIVSGSSNTLPATQIFNSTTAPGTITYSITPSLGGCDGKVAHYVVTVNPSPIITRQPDSFHSCVRDTPDTLSVASANGLGIPTYQWYRNKVNDNTTGDTIAGAQTATYIPPTGIVDTLYYYCVVTYPSGECPSISSKTAQVIISPYPVLTNYTIVINSGEAFTFPPAMLNGGDVLPVGTTYTWTSPVISPANSITGASGQSTPQTVMSQTLFDTAIASATATYTVTPASGQCVGKDFTVVVKVGHPLAPNITQKNISCFGANDGSLQTAITGGVPFKSGTPYLVNWTGSNGFTSTDATITNLSQGNYTLTIKDSVDTVFTHTYAIIEPAKINLKTVKVSNVSCHGTSDGEIVLLVTGGTPPYVYSWKKDAISFTGSADIDSLGPGNYTVIVTDSTNCSPQNTSYTITEKPDIVISLVNQVNLNCYGDNVGAVSIDVTGGDPIEKTPGVSGYNYSWKGPTGYTSTAKNLTNLVAGIYTLTVTDNAGCNKSFTVTITQPEELILVATSTPVTCYGNNDGSITTAIQGGVKPYHIQWSNLGQGTFQDNLSPGTYTIQVTDSNGCAKSASVVIAEADFAIQPVVNNITCFGAHNGSINLNIQGGTASLSLAWNDNPTAGYTRNNLGSGTYVATLKNATACIITDSFTIIEPTKLNLSDSITNAFDCNNPNSGGITLTISGGTPPYKTVWSNGEMTKDLSAVAAGTYVATITDSTGCTTSKSFVVMRPDPIVLSVDTLPDYNCQISVLEEKCTARVTGGMPPYQFTWSSGTTSGKQNEFMETTQPGIVVVGVTDRLGCTSGYTFNVSLPVPGIEYQVLDCNTRSFGFNAILPSGVASDYSFLWNFGDGTTDATQSPRHTFSSYGTYTVSLTLKNSTCTSVFKKDITVTLPPVLVLDKSPVFCIGDSLLLHVSGADTYRWSNGSTVDSTLIKQTGDYFVSGTSNAGCTTTLNFTVTNSDLYNYTIQTDKNEVTPDEPMVQFWSESIPYSDYFWDFGDGQSAEGNNQNHTYTITRDGYYDVKLQVKNPNGCTEYATKRIWIATASLPNVFTPNGDGIDDIFMHGWHIQVYNRNGILLYDGTGGWDGTYKGSNVSNDTYFYVLYTPTVSGIKTRTGFVTVIR